MLCSAAVHIPACAMIARQTRLTHHACTAFVPSSLSGTVTVCVCVCVCVCVTVSLLHRKFFEALYESLICILDEAFDRLKKRPEIEKEMGSLFRSKHFNMYSRRHQPPRYVAVVTVF